MVQNALARPSRFLTFPPSLEARFEVDTNAARQRSMRLLGTIAAVLFASFVYNDMQLPDGLREHIIKIRLLDSFLMLFMAQFLSRLEVKVWLRECAREATLASLIFSILYMLYLDPNDVNKTIYVSGLIAVMIFSMTVFPTLFRYLLPHSLFLAVVVEIGLFKCTLPGHARLSYCMIFISMMVIALITAYRQEMQHRRDYLRNLNETMRYINLKLDSERLRHWAARDGMTGAFNRGYFGEQFPREVLRAARDRLPLSLLMIDIDHFKIYNDTFGHVAGDRCLIEVVRTIQRQMKRSADFVARFGGEEFVVVLPETDLFGASRIADSIQAEIRNFDCENNKVLEQFVTLSIGVAAFDPYNDVADWEGILKRADEALYKAKNSGRNSINLYCETGQHI